MSLVTVRKLEDLNDFEKLALLPLSYSRIDSYQRCPAKYYYSYIAKEEGVTGVAALLGKIVHSVMENCLESNMLIDKDVLEPIMLAEYELQFEIQDPDLLIDLDKKAAGIFMIQEFLDRHQGEVLEQVQNEYYFEIVIGCSLFRGYIDKIEIFDDSIHISDWKTGSWEVSYKDAPTNMQLGIYALATRLYFPDKPIYAELYYLKSGRRKGHLFTEDDLNNMASMVNKYAYDIGSATNFPVTRSPKNCYMCDFSKNGVCSVGFNRINKR